MKCFLCPLNETVLALPAENVKRICAAKDISPAGNVSVPEPPVELLPGRQAVHAALLKNGGTLLLPEIDMDMDIPDEEIRSLPALAAAKIPWLSGAWFDPAQHLVLIVDPERLNGLQRTKR